jgi:hypothetical protein
MPGLSSAATISSNYSGIPEKPQFSRRLPPALCYELSPFRANADRIIANAIPANIVHEMNVSRLVDRYLIICFFKTRSEVFAPLTY